MTMDDAPNCPICGQTMYYEDGAWWCDDCTECIPYDDDGSDVGCDACGNPAYPNCKDSCPMFDD